MTIRRLRWAVLGACLAAWPAGPRDGRAAAQAAFRFTVTADSRAERASFRHVLDEITRTVGDEGVFHISPGDIDPPQDNFNDLASEFGSDVVWYPNVGNHEEETASDMDWIRSRYAGLPYIVRGGPANGTTTTYSFDYGNAHYVVLNEYYNGSSDTGTDGDVVDALYNWMVTDLNANTRPAVFVIGHEPAYPEVRHVGDSLDQYPTRRDRFWKLLNDRKVIAYLCGHTHNYYRKQVAGPDWTAFTWQIDVGNAGRDSNGDGFTFLDVTVTDTQVRFDTWRGTTGAFAKQDTWTVAIPPPAAPSNLAAAAVSTSQVDLSWTDNSSNETGFKIERKTGTGGTWSQVATVGAGTTTCQNTGLSASTTYFYRVRSYGTSGNSAYSNEAGATTPAPPPTPPAAPSGLSATAASSSRIDLSWSDNSSNETGFKVERKTGSGGTYAQIASVAAGVTAYQDSGLAASTTYYYRVRAYNTAGNSSYSNEANATTQAPPSGSGLSGEYFNNADLTGLALTRTDGTVDFNWASGSPDPAVAADSFSVRWTGRVQAQFTELYTFTTRTDDGARLWVNGELLVDQWVNQSATEWSGTIALVAGVDYTIELDYYENTGSALAQLSWSSASTPKQVIPQAALSSSTGPPDSRDNDGDGIPNDADPDDDNDGIPDLQDFDRDGDGVSNVAEGAAGTDPDDRDSFPGAGEEDDRNRCGATGFEALLLLALAGAWRAGISRSRRTS